MNWRPGWCRDRLMAEIDGGCCASCAGTTMKNDLMLECPIYAVEQDNETQKSNSGKINGRTNPS
jgi:hypothetical protein